MDPSARGVDEEEYLPAARLGGNQDGRVDAPHLLRAAFLIEPGDFTDTHADSQAGPDNRASASARDIVEIVGKHEVFVPAELHLELLFDFGEHSERDHAANAATVEGEKFARTRFGELVFERWCL